jgi:hypothetical protein
MVPVVMAFAFFIIYLLQIRNQPFVRYLVANPLIYDDEARKILEGFPRTQPFFLSPLYPAFMALVYALSKNSRLLLQAVQGGLLAINVGLLGGVCSKILPRKAAVLAMFVMTFYWSFYYFAGEFLPTTLCLTFLLAGWLLFTRETEPGLHPVAIPMLGSAGMLTLVYATPALRHLGSLLSGRSLPAPPRAYWAALAVFVVFTLASAALLFIISRLRQMRDRLNLLASGLVLGVGIFIWSGLSLAAGLFAASLLRARSGRLLRAGVFLLGLGVPVAAGISHNYLISGDFIPATSSLGVNIFIGNNPASDGMNPFSLGRANEVRIEADRLGLSGAKRSAFFRKQATSFIRTEPRRWVMLLAKKALVSVSRFSVNNNADISERRDSWTLLFLPVLHFGIIFPLGIAGIRYLVRDERQAYTAILGFTACMAVCMIFFVAERFRLPAVVFLMPLAALGCFGLYGDLLARRWRSLAVGIIIGGCAAIVSNVDFLGLSHLEFASMTVNRAHVMRLAGNLAEARKLVEHALREEPENAGAFFQLGAIEEAQGNGAAAISDYLDCLDRDPFFYAAYSGARRILEAGRVSPSYVDTYIDLVLNGKPHAELHQRLVEYVAGRTLQNQVPNPE